MNCYKCPLWPQIERWREDAASALDYYSAHHEEDKSLLSREELSAACRECGEKNSRNNGDGDTFDHKGRLQVALVENWSSEVDKDFLDSKISLGEKPLTNLSIEQEESLKKLLCNFAALSYKDAPLALGLLKGETIAEIGRKLSLSRQATHARLKSLIARAPWIRSLHVREKLFQPKPFGKLFMQTRR